MSNHFILIRVDSEGVFIDEESEYGIKQFQAFCQECYNTSKSDLPFSAFMQATQQNLFRRDDYPAKIKMQIPDTDIVLYVMNISHEDWALGTDFNLEMIQLKDSL